MKKKATLALISSLNKKMLVKSRLSQVWVETMIYTLIAFTLIGLVLAFVKPKIEEAQDKVAVEQSVKILEDIDLIVKNLGGPGNQRIVNLMIKKGDLSIDGNNDTLFFKIESKYEYSQPGETISIGIINATTKKMGKTNEVTLISNYSSNYNITIDGVDQLKKVTKAQTPYNVKISEKGVDFYGRIIIDITVN